MWTNIAIEKWVGTVTLSDVDSFHLVEIATIHERSRCKAETNFLVKYEIHLQANVLPVSVETGDASLAQEFPSGDSMPIATIPETKHFGVYIYKETHDLPIWISFVYRCRIRQSIARKLGNPRNYPLNLQFACYIPANNEDSFTRPTSLSRSSQHFPTLHKT